MCFTLSFATHPHREYNNNSGKPPIALIIHDLDNFSAISVVHLPWCGGRRIFDQFSGTTCVERLEENLTENENEFNYA